MDRFGNPSVPSQTAADMSIGRQPNARPLGWQTGAPPQTSGSQIRVTPAVNGLGVAQVATKLVPPTRENRFITLTAPLNNWTIYISFTPHVSLLNSLPIPAGIPYEISLAGNQELYAVTDAPTFQRVSIQIAPAIASDTERRL